MAEQHAAAKIEPEVADHLVSAMEEHAVPGPATVAVAMAMAGERQWPDGMGKTRHPREQDAGHGRRGHEAAVPAVHRTSRPQMPHSS